MTDYKLVPVEPTAEMVSKGARHLKIMSLPEREAASVFRAMLAAAPDHIRDAGKTVSDQLRGGTKKIGRPQIREVFLRNGACIEPDRDDLPDWVYESVFELLEHQAAERDRLLAESRANDQQAMAYLSEVRALVGGDDFPDMVRRCEKLRKDAERYLFVRTRVSASNARGPASWTFHYYQLPRPISNPLAGPPAWEHFDAAIDKAMQGDQP